MANTGTLADLDILTAFIKVEQNENLRMMATHAQAKLENRLMLRND